ncbi:hypothetical protein BdWA1_000215 [Babesia duncani]|uniref:Uncharacterized protein n=1 Tax=Babesia duncani TaxID=323732 RepID=A0AAD9UPQ1_9APIC|nr:hypothetical protein BdWA1_000215 [Babesia duncani]
MSTLEPSSPQVTIPPVSVDKLEASLHSVNDKTPIVSSPITMEKVGSTPTNNMGSFMSHIPTVYLPPLHYMYDSSTGKLVQLSGDPKPQAQSTPLGSIPGHSTPLQSSQSIPAPLLQSSNVGQARMQQMAPQPLQPTTPGYYAMPTFANTGPLYQYHQGRLEQHEVQHQPQQQMQQQYHHELPQYPDPYQEALKRHNQEQILKGGAQTFAQACNSAVNVAQQVSRMGDLLDPSIAMNHFQALLHPASLKYQQAAVFKFERLESVPIKSHTGLKIGYRMVIYLDPASEHFSNFTTGYAFAIPTLNSSTVDCDMMGQTVKVPFNGQEFVYIKLIENFGQMQSIVGRLKLHIGSLVPGHPLRVAIIGDDGMKKGNAIFEFSMGHVSLEQLRQSMQANPRALESMRLEQQARTNRMPDYDEALARSQRYQRENVRVWADQNGPGSMGPAGSWGHGVPHRQEVC